MNKILNHIYSDLLKRQGYIPTARVGRSGRSSNVADLSNLINRFPELLLRFQAAADSKERLNDASDNLNNLINKRQFLPPPRIGKREIDDSPQLTKETLALNQLSSNAIDGSSADLNSLSNLGNFLQEESNQVEPIDVRTLSKLIKWINLNKNKQMIANALSEKRATFHNSRLGRSAPLTPRLGRSYWELSDPDSGLESTGNEHNDNYESSAPINSRIIRTALTPRIGKRSLNVVDEKVM